MPGFNAVAHAVEGVANVYKKGGSILHYLWFDIILSHVTRIYLFSHSFIAESWATIQKLIAGIEKARAWTAKKAADVYKVIHKGLGDGLNKASGLLRGLIKVGELDVIRKDAVLIGDELKGCSCCPSLADI